ncbi:MAG: hypothetical protein ACPLRA_02115, partial [Candidatus Saccharicenans sp.]
WKLFYRQGNHWTEVKAKGSYGVEKDKYNIVKFLPVTTTGLKIELKLQKDFSAGLQEWKIK